MMQLTEKTSRKQPLQKQHLPLLRGEQQQQGEQPQGERQPQEEQLQGRDEMVKGRNRELEYSIKFLMRHGTTLMIFGEWGCLVPILRDLCKRINMDMEK